MQEGMKFDNEKPRMDLVFGAFHKAMEEVAKVGTFGAKKYADNNWRQVRNLEERYLSAALRHYFAYQEVTSDEESGLHHLAHMAWCVLAVLQTDLEPTC